MNMGRQLQQDVFDEEARVHREVMGWEWINGELVRDEDTEDSEQESEAQDSEENNNQEGDSS